MYFGSEDFFPYISTPGSLKQLGTENKHCHLSASLRVQSAKYEGMTVSSQARMIARYFLDALFLEKEQAK